MHTNLVKSKEDKSIVDLIGKPYYENKSKLKYGGSIDPHGNIASVITKSDNEEIKKQCPYANRDETFDIIDDINSIFDNFCKKISHEHHKPKDGVWEIHFRRWANDYVISHEGYWLDTIWVESKELLSGLREFRTMLKVKIQKQISNYDFKNHCGKDSK